MTYFVDTNIIVYSRDATEKKKQQIAWKWMKRLWEDRTGRLSYQVLNEYFHIVTRKLDPGLSIQNARSDVRDLFAWKPRSHTRSTIKEAWSVQDRWNFSWWDSLIIASAHHQGCRWLLTEDLQDGQDIDGLTVVNPFA